jgi:hypothetical protein
MLNIEQILDTMDTSHLDNFDKNDFLKYVKYRESTVKTIPIQRKTYYLTLYKLIKTIHDKQFLRSKL